MEKLELAPNTKAFMYFHFLDNGKKEVPSLDLRTADYYRVLQRPMNKSL
jgi:hypothetical protein